MMLLSGRKLRITKDSPYYICLFLWVLVSVLTKSTAIEIIPEIYSISRFVLYCSTAVIGTRYIKLIYLKNKRTKAVTLLIIFSSLLGLYFSGREEIYILMLFVVCAVDIDIERAVKWLFWGELTGVVLVVTLSGIGIIDNYIYVASRGDLTVTRYSMGFSHPNAFAIIVFQVIMCSMFLKKKNVGLTGNILLLLGANILYKITYSRTIFFVLIGIAFYNIISIFAEKFHGNAFWDILARSSARLLIIIGCLGSIYVGVTYSSGNHLVSFITNFESSRPMLLSEALNFYDITLFGQEINLISSSEIHNTVGPYAVLDNAYIFIILEFGIINTIWIISLYLLTIKKIKYSSLPICRKEILILCIIGYLLIAITEKYSFDLFYNYTLFIINYQIYGKNTKTSIKKTFYLKNMGRSGDK